jgi:hypothetical protein
MKDNSSFQGKTMPLHEKGREHLKILQEARGQIAEGLKVYDFLMTNVFKLISALLDRPDVTKNSDLADVTHLHLVRSMKTYESVRVLLHIGHDQDALAMLRNLTDTELSLEYIAADISRVQRFRDWAEIEKFKHNRGRESDNLESLVSPSLAQRLTASEQEYKKKYGSIGRSWSGLHTKEMAIAIDRVEHYYSVYKITSNYTHSSYVSLGGYKHRADKLPAWGPTIMHADTASFLATSSLMNVAQAYVEIHGIEGFEELLLEINTNFLICRHHCGDHSNFIIQVPEIGTWVIYEHVSAFIDPTRTNPP